MLEQIKMPADGYKVKVIYYLNPHLIWIEVCDPNVTTDEYIFEQIGLYGILPLETTLDIEEEVIKVQKCHDWIIAATTLMTNELKGSTEVWFTPTYIDRRTSIFDDNIHKYGELIIKSKNGELKQLSKLLINSNIAHFDVCEFHQKLSSGEIKTKLCSIKTQNVVKEIENYYTRTANSKITCKKAIAKQTSVFQIGQGLESALTVSNLERHNNKMLNTVLENKMKDLELCKDVDDESIGCGFRKSKDRTLETLSLSSVTIDSKCNDTQELDQTFKDIKVFLDANAKSNNNPSGNVPEAVKISVDVKKPHGSMLIKKLKIMNQADRDKINKVRMKHKLNIEQQIDKTSISTVKPIEQKDRPIESNDRKMQVVYDKDDVKNVAYGPPGMDPKLWKIEVVKQDSQGDVTEVINVGDVSEEMESESRNLIDQGDWIEIPMEHIIPITEKFINKLPFQAIECRLIGIEPPGEEWSDFSKNWFCNNCFEDKNGDLKHLYIKYFTKEAAEFTGGYKYGVALIDTNTPNDVVINQLMIDLNLAKENIKEREYLNKLLPDAKESGHEQTFEEENSYLNLHPDTNESDHVETFEEVENEDDDEKMTKINQDRGSAGNSTVQIPQPIRSVPLVDSDSSDFERWDVNLDQSVLSTLFPRINSNIQAKVTQDTDDDVSTDENQVIPFRSRETNTEVNIQIKQNDPQELDSDDFTSSETSQTFNVCNDKQNLLSVVEQKRRPKLLWRQTKNVVFVKIELIAVKEYDLEFDVRNLKFSCNLNDATYEFDIELYGVIDRDKSSHLKTGFNIIVKLVKVLKTKWVSLTKSFDTKNWIAYDADSIDTSSDEEEVDRSTMENIIKVMHGTDDESDDDEFLDDVNYEYGKHN
ncbi:putative ATP-dependent RNA helicase TDRD12 isoform X2 [Nymphalis io]|uniref:putative ATP-dependent RNA helicase TDRD12 isoform X2 n=1 Tax=Inachis io TaxID=171585 RepID=UPI002168D108|nr:putative ATP-dependent RNA helicase TDRD12 isoform X2 [Nymphalis io]